jgi:hypothetical protein
MKIAPDESAQERMLTRIMDASAEESPSPAPTAAASAALSFTRSRWHFVPLIAAALVLIAGTVIMFSVLRPADEHIEPYTPETDAYNEVTGGTVIVTVPCDSQPANVEPPSQMTIAEPPSTNNPGGFATLPVVPDFTLAVPTTPQQLIPLTFEPPAFATLPGVIVTTPPWISTFPPANSTAPPTTTTAILTPFPWVTGATLPPVITGAQPPFIQNMTDEQLREIGRNKILSRCESGLRDFSHSGLDDFSVKFEENESRSFRAVGSANSRDEAGQLIIDWHYANWMQNLVAVECIAENNYYYIFRITIQWELWDGTVSTSQERHMVYKSSIVNYTMGEGNGLNNRTSTFSANALSDKKIMEEFFNIQAKLYEAGGGNKVVYTAFQDVVGGYIYSLYFVDTPMVSHSPEQYDARLYANHFFVDRHTGQFLNVRGEREYYGDLLRVAAFGMYTQ